MFKSRQPPRRGWAARFGFSRCRTLKPMDFSFADGLVEPFEQGNLLLGPRQRVALVVDPLGGATVGTIG